MGIFPSNLPLESSPRVLPSIYPSKLPSHISACQGNDPWTKIVDAAHDLRIIRNLSNAHIRRVAVATEVLQQEQNSPKRQKYQLFLYNVLRKCGPHAVLVCAIALSQRLVFEMKNNDRKTLVNILEKNKGNTIINDSTLRSLASRHKIPSSVEGTVWNEIHNFSKLLIS